MNKKVEKAFVIAFVVEFFISLAVTALASGNFILGILVFLVLGVLTVCAFFVVIFVNAIIYDASTNSQVKPKKVSIKQNNTTSAFTPKETKYIGYVKQHSPMVKKIIELNERTSFEKISSSDYVERCDSLRQYNKIDEHLYLRDVIERNIERYKRDIDMAEKNRLLWERYELEYEKIESYLTEFDIKSLPERKVRPKVFMAIERKIYKYLQLSQPQCRVNMTVKVLYTSPQGRNSYTKSAQMSHLEIKVAIPEIESKKIEYERELYEAAERKRREKLERDAEKMLEEEEIRRIRAKRELERAIKREKQSEYTAAKNKRFYEKLKLQEAELEKREAEFVAATSGHIYTFDQDKTDEKTIAREQQNDNASAWVQLKRLKAKFDNGELTYDEYERQRRDLLRS